MKATIVRFHHL